MTIKPGDLVVIVRRPQVSVEDDVGQDLWTRFNNAGWGETACNYRPRHGEPVLLLTTRKLKQFDDRREVTVTYCYVLCSNFTRGWIQEKYLSLISSK